MAIETSNNDRNIPDFHMPFDPLVWCLNSRTFYQNSMKTLADPITWASVCLKLSVEHKIRCNKLKARLDTAVQEKSVFLSWVAHLMILFLFTDCLRCCKRFLTKMGLDFSCWGPRNKWIFRFYAWPFAADFFLNVQFTLYHFRWIVLVSLIKNVDSFVHGSNSRKFFQKIACSHSYISLCLFWFVLDIDICEFVVFGIKAAMLG